MATHDLGHKLTDKELAALEKRIAGVYKDASDGLNDTISEYFSKFVERDKHQQELLKAGKITEEQYKQWRLNQIGRGKRYEALRDEIAKRYTDANQVAVSYVNDATPGIYSLNRNYAAYTIEKEVGNVGFNLFDEQTVKRLAVEEPNLMPYYPPKRAVARGIDLAWGKQQITASVTSGILQGYSVGKIADDLQDRMEKMNRSSALRTARTAITGAQNAGRQDSYIAAEKMGIKMKREWLATLDNRTRHAHAVLDGQRVGVNEPFEVDGYEIMFPGDPTAKAYLVYNCRCTLIAAVDGVDTSDAQRRARDPETGESMLIEDMTYSEWAGWKEKAQVQKAMAEKQESGIGTAKTNADIVDQMNKNGWFSPKSKYSASLEGADFESAMSVYRGYEKFYDRYPQMKGKFLPVVCEDLSRKQSYAQASTFGGGVSVNRSRYSSVKKLAEDYAKDVRLGFHTKGTDYQSLVTHECGHGLDGYLTTVLGKKKSFSMDMRKSVLKATGSTLADVGDGVSIYATKDNYEFFAECLAEGLWSENPRPIAREFMKQLDEVMKGVK